MMRMTPFVKVTLAGSVRVGPTHPLMRRGRAILRHFLPDRSRKVDDSRATVFKNTFFVDRKTYAVRRREMPRSATSFAHLFFSARPAPW